MNAHRITGSVSLTMLTTLWLSASVWADGIPRVFLDDFEDGDATDGAPVTWVPSAAWPGDYLVIDGDYVFANSVDSLMTSGVNEHVLTDVSILTQARVFQSDVYGIGVWARLNRSAGNSYFCLLDIAQGRLEIGRLDGGSDTTLDWRPLTLDVMAEDIMIRFDVVGSNLSAWIWRVGEPMPSDPPFTVVDDTHASGVVGVTVDPTAGGVAGNLAAFRFFRASRPGAGFYDDFEDGDPADDAPVTWVPNASRPGDYSVVDGDYVLTLPQDPDGIMGAGVPEHILSDTSVMAQVRAVGSVDSLWVTARGDDVQQSSYLGGIIPGSGDLFIHRRDGFGSGDTLETASSSLDASTEDVLLRLDAIGSELRLWAWRPGEPMPSAPQVTAVDATYPIGMPRVGANFGGAGSTNQAVFRFVDMSGVTVPPPALVQVCPTLGDAVNQDYYISPKAPTAGGLTEVEIEMNEPCDLLGPICVTSTGTSPPASATRTDIGVSGPNVYKVVFSDPIELAEWTTAIMTVENIHGMQADICFHVAWLPGDCNQDGRTSMADATEFGNQFNGEQQPLLADLNGDGQINLNDATKFGQIWNGTSGEGKNPDGTGGWNRGRLPDGDGIPTNGSQPPPCECP